MRSQSPNRLPVYHDKKENGPCDDSVLTSDVLFAVAFGLTLVNHFSFSAAEVQLPAASRLASAACANCLFFLSCPRVLVYFLHYRWIIATEGPPDAERLEAANGKSFREMSRGLIAIVLCPLAI